jgi:Flp pilus assembly protein TadD
MRPLTRITAVVLLVACAGCSTAPFKTEPPPTAPAPGQPGTTAGRGPSVPTQPPTPAGPGEPTIEAPMPSLPRERPKVPPATLTPAGKALVTQAQTQRKRGDLPGATVSLERALRIEPNNPLLWIEMGRLRMDQQNYPQAEAMGRKALAMAVGDARTQSSAWLLISDALKARGRNPQAEEALAKSRELAAT